jgi:signal transduction histidine kinase/ligand-binding sensor domain-containing protein/CheY-like chemotaxis protein/HPt (histidine-containing phosphotransfer) domain-containing protein
MRRVPPRPTRQQRGRRHFWRGVFVVCTGLVALFARAAESVATAAAGNAKTEQYFFEKFGEDLGLLQTDVILAILRTRDGYLWIGTERGLTRFDGVRFVSYRASNTPAFANNLIHCLFESRDGQIWIGTERGVLRYHDGHFERFILEDIPVRAIAQDSQGRVWLGSFGHSLYMWDQGTLHSYATELTGHSPRIRCVYVDASDRLWMGFFNERGVVCLANGVFTQPFRERFTWEIGSICEQPRGTIWLGSGTGHRLWRLRGNSYNEYLPRDGLAASQVFALQPSNDGGVWVAAGSLQKVTDTENFTITTLDRLPYDRVRTVYEDKENSVWLAARDAGLVRARLLPYRLYSAADGVPSAGVKTVAQDPAGNIWFATSEATIGRVSPAGLVQMMEAPQRAVASSVFAAHDGSVWVGSSVALSVWRDGTWETFANVRGAYGIFEDSRGGIWVGVPGSVLRYDGGKFTTIKAELSPMTRASAFAEGPDGAVYIGLWDSGLLKVVGDKVTAYDHRNGLPTDDVRAVYVDHDGRLWVGLRSRGLAVLEGDRWLNPHTLSEAVADHVSAIVEDGNGALWLGTPAGVMWAPITEILAAARGTQPAPRMRRTEATDGGSIAAVWSGAQPIVWHGREHKLIFATRRGVLAIDPTHFPRNQIPPPVRIETVTADHRAFDATAEVHAPAGTRDVTIEYTALSFIQSKEIAFEYKLEGYDADWVPAGSRRTAFYTHIPPGHYTFRVRAQNSDGMPSDHDATITFVQEPRFYQTSWFFAAVLAAIGATVWGLHQRRTAALRRENEKLNNLVANRTRELELANRAIADHSQELEIANRAKSEFLENVSHEIRNPLNGITGLLGLLKQQPQAPEARELTDSVQACARTLTRAFEDVLGYSKLEHGNVVVQETVFSLRRLITEAVAGLRWQAEQQGNHITVEIDPALVDGYLGDEAKIKTIVSNFIGNAIKYAPQAAIDIRAEEEPMEDGRAQVHIEVSDHGPGIPLEEQELVFKKFVRGSQAKSQHVAGAGLGLAMCRMLAESLDGSVGVESELGRGSTFYVCAPLRRSALPDDTSPAGDGTMGGGASVLIVEDEKYNQIVLSGIALELGYAPDVASTVAEAEGLLVEKRFPIAFVDWELPDGDGSVVARKIREGSGEAAIIVATTAYDNDDIRRRCRAAGMDDFLVKPYDSVLVRDCLRRIASRRAGLAAPAESAPRPNNPGLNLDAFQSYARRFPDQATQAQQLYRDSLQQEFAAVRRGHAAGDGKKIAAAAHRLHALGGLIGAKELVDVARDLTTRARQATLVSTLDPDIALLEKALENVQMQLTEIAAAQ